MDDIRGQHYVECDNCETEPAQFHCLTCQGHLCEECKETHVTRRLTQGHEVILLSEYIKNPSACHDVKGKVPCACDIKRDLREERERINNVLIPSLEKIRDEEYERKESLSRKVSDMIEEFENHCENLIDRLTRIKEKTANRLERKQEEISDAIDNAIDKIDAKIGKLERRSSKIDDALDWASEDLSEDLCKRLDESKLFPKLPIVDIKEFSPGSLEKKSLQAVVGELPVINLQ